jgi:chaperonin cofactor prefoldin
MQESIEDLKLKLDMERQVKESEVMLNKELKERIEKLELHIETLLKINEEFSNTIGKLRARLKELVVKS